MVVGDNTHLLYVQAVLCSGRKLRKVTLFFDHLQVYVSLMYTSL